MTLYRTWCAPRRSGCGPPAEHPLRPHPPRPLVLRGTVQGVGEPLLRSRARRLAVWTHPPSPPAPTITIVIMLNSYVADGNSRRECGQSGLLITTRVPRRAIYSLLTHSILTRCGGGGVCMVNGRNTSCRPEPGVWTRVQLGVPS